MSSSHQIHSLLKDANLLKYADKFICHGADDAKQIALSSRDEFEKLINYVGMFSKPLHVTRLLTSLHKKYGIAPRYDAPPIPSKSELIYQGQPDFTATGSSVLFENLPKKRKATPYYGEIKMPSDQIFTELTDERTEAETRELIGTLSAIYKNEPLTKYQQYINACAAELSIRDPTLLARRAELAVKAREANMRSGNYKFHKGFSVSKAAPKEVNRKSGINFVAASKHREERLKEIKNLETCIQTYMFEKEGLFGRLKHQTDRDNKVAIGIVRSRLDYLEEQIYIAKKRAKKLRLAQRRSENYFISKLNTHDEGGRDEGETQDLVIEMDGITPEDGNTPEDCSTHDPIKIMNSNPIVCGRTEKKQIPRAQMKPETLSIDRTLEEMGSSSLADSSPLSRDYHVTSSPLSRDYQRITVRSELPTYGLAAHCPTEASSSHGYQPIITDVFSSTINNNLATLVLPNNLATLVLPSNLAQEVETDETFDMRSLMCDEDI